MQELYNSYIRAIIRYSTIISAVLLLLLLMLLISYLYYISHDLRASAVSIVENTLFPIQI